MINSEEVVRLLENLIDHDSLQYFITKKWVQPIIKEEKYYFEDIDVARVRLICQLRYDMEVNDEAMDIVLSLLDQLYGLREQMRQLTASIEQQPREVQAEIFSLLTQHDSDI